MSDDLERKAEEIIIQYSVGPSFEDAVKYATGEDGAVDLLKMQKLEGRYTHIHGNRNCDVLEGPCACGGWH